MEKYNSLADLINAYHRGELTAPLTIDNDSTFVYANERGEKPSDDDDVAAIDCVYDAHPAELLEECLDLLGIPHDHV